MPRPAPRRPGPCPDGCARCLPVISWLMRAPSRVAPAEAGPPQPWQIPSNRSRCATSGGPDAWRRDCRLRGHNAKRPAKATGSGRRSGIKTRRMSWLYFSRSTWEANAVAVKVGQSRLYGNGADPSRRAAANRRGLCHPCGIAAGPRVPVEGPGRRGPRSRGAHQSKGLVASVPGESPCDGRGRRRPGRNRGDAGHWASPVRRSAPPPSSAAPCRGRRPSAPWRTVAFPGPPVRCEANFCINTNTIELWLERPTASVAFRAVALHTWDHAA
jgi:hypothetical protein